ncbi:hypothetical protein FQN49_001111 [Arthroderma sp. PD_2]|nr:hypothetical protein FQN49_001111 [Arthroderma sp. PD_2]
MEQKVLAIHHKSLKRKRAESELSEEPSPPPPSRTQPNSANLPDNRDQDDVKTSGACTQGAVASRLQELDIQSPATPQELQAVCQVGNEDQSRRLEDSQELHTSDGHTESSVTSTEAPEDRTTEKADIDTAPSPSINKTCLDIAETSNMGSPSPHQEAVTTDLEEESLTWDDSEITGHYATDPNDDGYGLNGIGFKPSAEVAWARSQQRKDQVAEWERREASEAREARSRRRQRNDGTGPGVITATSNPKQKKVKFDA